MILIKLDFLTVYVIESPAFRDNIPRDIYYNNKVIIIQDLKYQVKKRILYKVYIRELNRVLSIMYLPYILD